MSYCKSCGAYIPDGQTKCLACGFDDAAEQQAAAAAAQAKKSSENGQKKYRQFDSDFLRKQLDEQRKRQQETSRKWAETEYAQRQKVKEEQARNFTNTAGASARSTTRNSNASRNMTSGGEMSKVFAGLSYISALFILPHIFCKDDKFAMYHAKQGLNLFVAGVIGDIVGSIFGLGWVVTLARLYFIYKGISNVVNGRKEPLPYIGNLLK
ncbi:MAG: hypothetical protein IJV41_02345 [Oscillospiraceae bacterium]|nr:hypothetical protein [Oscillospiraceae bacterium]